ncbi:MAG: tetratricopeptide repeat protein [Caldilineaceae bacterium]|nr:tetratricopeptide repeat protein [Caldilineaceae bacterium]MCY4118092.1 tetratricopeptide repeat protein [Caldilineaceae bacterium]
MQRSKIQNYCESTIEACWLAALIITPLFFNVYSSRVFEPDKISLLRSIALVMLLAYLVKLLDGGRLWPPAGEDASTSRGQRVEGSGAQIAVGRGQLAGWWRQPLLLPFALLIVSFAISTVLSISPSVSWWGSYHRLQGAYTFASYLTITVLTAAHLRHPSQLRRLQHTIVLTSLPIAIYGVIQHFGRDPLPWGEDVTTRVAANAGNAIFLAAYLIMAFFLTLERAVSSFVFLLRQGSETVEESSETENGPLPPPDYSLAGILAGGCYLFVLIVQLIAIFWTQSRGPMLGLAVGVYIFVLLFLTGLRPRDYRAWTAVWVGLGAAGAVFLILLNITILGAGFRQVPIWGRMATMLESGTGTGRVRVLIWEGVAQLVAPHEPLTFPDGRSDSLNLLRPLIGYGPEAMWLAYNRFYQPELAQWEARNRTPDRSHNETWDSLAITGGLGFLANSLLFLSVFFWALRWLGLIRSRRDVALFFSLSIGGGLLLSLSFLALGVSAGFLGVNWPTGLVVGLIAYVTLAVFIQPESQTAPDERRRQLLIVALFAAIIAHYVEIHFGIAIVATRTYFWIIAATLLALGMRWLAPGPYAADESSAQTGTARKPERTRGDRRPPRSRSGRRRRPDTASGFTSFASIPSTALPDLLVLWTVLFLFVKDVQGSNNAFSTFFKSLTMFDTSQGPTGGAPVFWLFVFTIVVAAVLGTSAGYLQQQVPGLSRPVSNASSSPQRAGVAVGPGGTSNTLPSWTKTLGLYSLSLLLGWLMYGLLFSLRLLRNRTVSDIGEFLELVAGHYSFFTWTVLLWCLGAGLVIAWRRSSDRRQASTGRTMAAASGALLATFVAFLIVSNVNIAQVRADVYYKQGLVYDNAGNWEISADLYRRALAVRPAEDYYMLFYGRSLLAKAAEAPVQGSHVPPPDLSLSDALGIEGSDLQQMGKEDLLQYAEVVLKGAQVVNPLNTDHAANLARLYRSWSDLVNDPQSRRNLLEGSLQHYEAALTLSPNAAHLWNEKANSLASLERNEESEEALLHSLSLDNRYGATYVLLADLYMRMDRVDNAVETLHRGLDNLPGNPHLLSQLGVAQSRAGDLEGALATNLLLVEKDRNSLGTLRNLLVIYVELGRHEAAMLWADRVVELLANGNVELDGNTDIYKLLADVYHENGRLNDAAAQLQILFDLAPENYRTPLRLADLQKELGNLQQALHYGQQALALAPENVKQDIQAFVDSLK